MKILDRYILREMLGPFIFGVVAFSSIFIGSDVLFKLARFYIRDGVPINILVRLFFLSIPEIVVLTFPMSMLLSSLLGQYDPGIEVFPFSSAQALRKALLKATGKTPVAWRKQHLR